MSYTSLSFYPLLLAVLAAYYSLPLRIRWGALLAGSMAFYLLNVSDPLRLCILLSGVIVSYAGALLMEKRRSGSGKALRVILCISILLSAAPLLLQKITGLLPVGGIHRRFAVMPLGCAFYTMQIIAYLCDVYHGKIRPQKNFLRYLLFITFFPQIIQGPIPRYEQLNGQLTNGNRFEISNLVRGYQLILWGFFLKMVLADRLSVVVDTIFGQYGKYEGMYVLAGGICYSIQLYADFYACVTLSRGIARLFGIRLEDNFAQPYLARSVKEFWRRWHLTLSRWFRDYIYIPLGGSRKGRLRKYFNLGFTFFVSGIWHGRGYAFVFWGLMHAVYQIVGELTAPFVNRVFLLAQMPEGSLPRKLCQTCWTFFCVMTAWIVFRAGSLPVGIRMIGNMFTTSNPWILFDGSLAELGLSFAEWNLVILGLSALIIADLLRERMSVTAWISRQHIVIRWGIYFGVTAFIWVYGVYGSGYRAADFIYGGF